MRCLVTKGVLQLTTLGAASVLNIGWDEREQQWENAYFYNEQRRSEMNREKKNVCMKKRTSRATSRALATCVGSHKRIIHLEKV
jgi:hypothetical protein